MTMRNRIVGPALLAGVLMLPTFAAAQAHEEEATVSPSANFLLTGYGAAGYVAAFDSDRFQHDFTALFVPLFLYQMGEDLLFEVELEFELEGNHVETKLEYAQINYLGWSRVLLTGGKFLLPFGTFGERFHAAWINELPSFPLLYGHGHGAGGVEPLLPVLSDVGAMLRLSESLGERWGLDLSLYVTQGPRVEAADEEHGEDPSHARVSGAGLWYQQVSDEGEHRVPRITIGDTFEDNNTNKLVGARLGLVHAPGFEAYVSGFYSRYDAEDELSLIGLNIAPQARLDRLKLRGEGIVLWQRVFAADGARETVAFPGYYAQVSVRLGRFEPVVRWSHLLEADLNGVTVKEDATQLALGLDYWIHPSVPVKLAYEVNFDSNDRLLVQWAYGF